MDADRKHFSNISQQGNAMIYVLLVVALFAALGFILARGSNTSETAGLSDDKARIYTSQIMGAPMQMKQALDTMVYSGAKINKVLSEDETVNFALPQDTVAFASGSNSDKFFHPEGGGAILPTLPGEAVEAQDGSSPAPGWYVGHFNDVEWTPSDSKDVVMTGWQVAKKICQQINEKLTGSAAIPVLAHAAGTLLIDKDSSGAGSNIRFTSAECAQCYGQPALCVQDAGSGPYAFYSVIGAE
jgi:hypothetical protein